MLTWRPRTQRQLLQRGRFSKHTLQRSCPLWWGCLVSRIAHTAAAGDTQASIIAFYSNLTGQLAPYWAVGANARTATLAGTAYRCAAWWPWPCTGLHVRDWQGLCRRGKLHTLLGAHPCTAFTNTTLRCPARTPFGCLVCRVASIVLCLSWLNLNQPLRCRPMLTAASFLGTQRSVLPVLPHLF